MVKFGTHPRFHIGQAYDDRPGPIYNIPSTFNTGRGADDGRDLNMHRRRGKVKRGMSKSHRARNSSMRASQAAKVEKKVSRRKRDQELSQPLDLGRDRSSGMERSTVGVRFGTARRFADSARVAKEGPGPKYVVPLPDKLSKMRRAPGFSFGFSASSKATREWEREQKEKVAGNASTQARRKLRPGSRDDSHWGRGDINYRVGPGSYDLDKAPSHMHKWSSSARVVMGTSRRFSSRKIKKIEDSPGPIYNPDYYTIGRKVRKTKQEYKRRRENKLPDAWLRTSRYDRKGGSSGKGDGTVWSGPKKEDRLTWLHTRYYKRELGSDHVVSAPEESCTPGPGAYTIPNQFGSFHYTVYDNVHGKPKGAGPRPTQPEMVRMLRAQERKMARARRRAANNLKK